MSIEIVQIKNDETTSYVDTVENLFRSIQTHLRVLLK